MKKIYGLFLVLIVFVFAFYKFDVSAETHSHQYTNGICECGEFEEAGWNDHILHSGYTVSNAGQLLSIANKYNSSVVSSRIIITNDITLPEGIKWNPIGTLEYPFIGKIDTLSGNPHTINLGVQFVKQSNYGFIGYSYNEGIESASIENIIVAGEFNVESSIENVGGILGSGENNIIINNCTSKVNINVLDTAEGSNSIGGIVGSLTSDVEINRCSNFGVINASGVYENVGGIAGIVSNGLINNSINYANISSNSTKYQGGIVGLIESENAVEIENTANLGVITGKSFNITLGSNDVTLTPGEIAGFVSNDLESNIFNNYYLGDVAFGAIKKIDESITANKITELDVTSGMLANLLGVEFGQKIDNLVDNQEKELYPIVGGDVVYHVYECNGVDRFYSNYNENKDHDYQYSVLDNIITQSCTNCNHHKTLTLQAPIDPYYDKSVKEIELVTDIEGLDVNTLVVEYDNEVIFPGRYLATVEYQGLKATLEFDILKAIPKASMFTFTNVENLVYDGNKKIINPVTTTEPGMGKIELTYGPEQLDYPTDAGYYYINLNVLEGEYYQNYSFSILDFFHSIIVNKKPITVSWTNTTLFYEEGKDYYFPDYQFNGVINQEKIVATISGQATTIGSYTASISINHSNYQLVGDNLSVDYVVKGKLVQTPEIKHAIYQKGLVQTADITDTDLYRVIQNNGGTSSGKYKVILELVDPVNYTWETTDEAQITLDFIIYTFDNSWIEYPTIENWVYGKPHIKPKYQYQNSYADVTITYREIGGVFSKEIPTEVGKYEVKLSFEKNDLRAAPLEDVILQFEILKAKPDALIDEVITSKYGVKLEDIVLTGLGDGLWSYVNLTDEVLTAGSHQVEVKFTPNDIIHYEEITKTITLKIEKVDAIYKSPVKVEGLVYNNDYQVVIIPGSTVDGDMYYKVNDGEWSLSVPTLKNANTYTIYYKVIGDNNHFDVAEQSFEVVIQKKDLEIVANDVTIEQFTQIPTLTYTLNGICYQDDLIVKPTLKTVENSDEAKTFEIKISNASNDNYNITYKNGKLNVTAHTECRGGVNSCTKLAVCEICNKEYGSLLDHQFNNYIYNNDATCVSKGTKTSKCSHCEEFDTVDVVDGSFGSHEFTNYKYNNDATCVSKGTETSKCSHCDELDTVDIIDGSFGSHEFKNYTYNNDATCVSKGTKSSKCSHCEKIDTIVNTEGKLGDHIFNDYKYNNDATCIKDGTITSKCIHCDEVDTLVLENSKTSHLNQNDDKHCDVCNEQIVPNSKMWLGALIGGIPVILISAGLYLFILKKKR